MILLITCEVKGLWVHIIKINKFNLFDLCCYGNGLLCVLWHFQPFSGQKVLKLTLKRMICILRSWSCITILKASCQSVNLVLYKQCKINFAAFHLVACLHLATLLVLTNWKTGKFSLFLTYLKSTCQGKHIFFLLLGNVLDIAPSIMIRTPWGIVSVKMGVARKSCIFTKNVNFAYIKHIHFTQISLHFTSLKTKIFHF